MDIRYQLLNVLKVRDLETKEFIANEFLSSLPHDLGTIKRALIELRNSNYIQESNVPPGASVIDDIVAVDNESPKKLRDANCRSIRLILTLDGRRFLLEDEKLQNELAVAKWNKKIFWMIFLISSASLLVSIVSLVKSSNVEKHEINIFVDSALVKSPKGQWHQNRPDSLKIN